jgi:hypothetical protein
VIRANDPMSDRGVVMVSRSIRQHSTGRGSTLRRSAVVAASLALVLAACGDDDADGDAAGVSVEDGTAQDGDDAEAPDDAEAADDAEASTDPGDDVDDAAAEGTDDADTEADGTDDEPAATGGPSEHRPPAAGQPDCDAVTASPPGAIISFPSDDDPSWLDAGPGPVTVEVVGCSDSFEATIQYDAFHGQDTAPTLSGFTEGGTMGNWGAFSFEETYWTSGEWTVVVFVDDAESGDRIEFDEVTFTVG